jgi:hypothetical protein
MKAEKDQVSLHKGRSTRPAGHSHWHRQRWALACFVAAFFLAGAAQAGQQPQAPDPSHSSPDPVPQATSADSEDSPVKPKDENPPKPTGNAAGAQHTRQIADDSARLLKLATDLKAEVDKTNKNTLSLRVIRTADELEHLAHSVHEKMKLTVAEN